ncbi:MAG: hypothetical protein ABI843_16905 [Dokdonella sp.]
MSPHTNETALGYETRKRLRITPVRIRLSLFILMLSGLPLVAAAGSGVSENFDEVTPPALPAGWSTHIATGKASDLPWATVAVGYANSAPNAAWLNDVDDYADISLVSPIFTLPSGGSTTISFHHSYVLWAPDNSVLANGVYSGGVLEVSINAGAFQDLVAAGGSFSAGGYNVALDPTFDNPLAQPPALNRSVWGGDSAQFVATTATLPSVAAGGTVQLRWRLGTEGSGSSHDQYSGWYIDDFTCDVCELVLSDTIFKDGFDGTP